MAQLQTNGMSTSKRTSLEVMVQFATTVAKVFGQEYLTERNTQNTQKTFGNERSKRFYRYSRIPRLHAMKMNELSIY